ncbi:MAG: SRPBCC domain-containing protein [Deltaproteobacteria bacterium]|nr:SRPBCC domain-containing protein [Deltaproteobacteria bacterium]MBW2363178.1 SRPBCC domain-containing protein [Deltaproteobacteria bacterium]
MPALQTVRAEIEIDARPEKVFDVLTDLAKYPEWNPFTPSIESTLEIGAPVRMRVRLLGANRLSRRVEYVTENERPSKLCWGADIPLRFLIRADRCQTLVPLEGGRTRYVCTDDISGWLAPLVIRFFGAAMQRGFEDCALALKKRAES